MNNRIYRINEDIQRELASLLRNIKDPRIKREGLISITAVDTSADLSQAKVYLSIYKTPPGEPGKKSPQQAGTSRKELLSGLKSASGYLRYELGRALSLRHVPELKFILDESIERGARISTILSDLEIDPSADDDSGDDSDDAG